MKYNVTHIKMMCPNVIFCAEYNLCINNNYNVVWTQNDCLYDYPPIASKWE